MSCPRCSQAIPPHDSQVVLVGSYKFHSHCFTCVNCGGGLYAGYAELQGELVCGKCTTDCLTDNMWNLLNSLPHAANLKTFRQKVKSAKPLPHQWRAVFRFLGEHKNQSVALDLLNQLIWENAGSHVEVAKHDWSSLDQVRKFLDFLLPSSETLLLMFIGRSCRFLAQRCG